MTGDDDVEADASAGLGNGMLLSELLGKDGPHEEAEPPLSDFDLLLSLWKDRRRVFRMLVLVAKLVFAAARRQAHR